MCQDIDIGDIAIWCVTCNCCQKPWTFSDSTIVVNGKIYYVCDNCMEKVKYSLAQTCKGESPDVIHE